MIIRVAEIVFGNMRMIKRRDIVGINANKRVRNIGTPRTQGLDLRPRQDKARLIAFAEFVVPRSFRVTNLRLLVVVLFLTH